MKGLIHLYCGDGKGRHSDFQHLVHLCDERRFHGLRRGRVHAVRERGGLPGVCERRVSEEPAAAVG